MSARELTLQFLAEPADVNFGGLCIGLQQLDCEWDIEDADATAAAIPTRYQVTYRTLVHDLTAQG